MTGGYARFKDRAEVLSMLERLFDNDIQWADILKSAITVEADERPRPISWSKLGQPNFMRKRVGTMAVVAIGEGERVH